MKLLSPFFDHPWLLAGLAGTLLPLVIEWLFRRRRRRIILPTLRFLLHPEDAKKIKRQDRLLLILRCVICGLSALAVSRPVLRADRVRLGASPHVVVVIDRTASMNQSVGVTTAVAEACKKTAEMLRQLPTGTRVSVLSFSDQAEVIVENSTETLAAAAKVEGLTAGEGSAPVKIGLAKAKEILDRAGTSRAEIYVLSDFQKFTWTRDASESAQLITDLSARHTLNLVDCAGDVEYNDAIVRLAPADPILAAHLPAKFVAEIHRFGRAPADARGNVIFLVDGEKKASQEYRGSGTLEFSYRFPDPGEHLVSLEIENDRCKLDNQRLFLASVPEAHKVLVLDPTAQRPGLSRTSFFLDRAIAPPVGPGFDLVSPFATKVVEPTAAVYENFDDYDVVVLSCDSVDEALAAKLNTRVRSGGSALVFLGLGINPFDYNRRLFKDGAGVLPCRVAASVTGARTLSLKSFPRLARQRAETALVAPERIALSAFVPLDTNAIDGLVTLGVDAATQSPAIVERSVGRGRAIVVGMPPDLSCSTFPASAGFALLTQDLLRELVGAIDADVNLQVGQPFEQSVMVSAQPLLLRTPAGKHERLVPEETSNGWRVRYTGAQRHGVYEIKTSAEVLRRRKFVVNVDTHESDLSKVAPDDLRLALGTGWNYISAQESWADSVGRRYATTETAPAVLWFLLAILAAEVLLASRFGRRRDRSFAAPASVQEAFR